MKRTAILTSWLITLMAAFAAGLWTARIPTGDTSVNEADPTIGVIEAATVKKLPSTDGGISAPRQASSPQPVESARELAASGKPFDAIDVLRSHLALNPYDAIALFELSDALQMTGQVDEALDPLFQVLAFPPTPEAAVRARSRLRLLINAREAGLLNRDDIAGLVRYYRDLTLADPGYDGYRLALVRWLLRSGELIEAERQLKEVGFVGVSDDELEAVAQQLQWQKTEVPVERRGDAMFAEVSATGRGSRTRKLMLLVDTGATMTGLAPSVLASIGARSMNRQVRVSTANGPITVPLYRLSGLKVGPVDLDGLEVLSLSALPDGVDGLLGMDVLQRLPEPVGRP